MKPLILASKSAIRAELLRRAGIEITIDAANIDEAAVKTGLKADGATPRDIADALAELKAQRVSGRHGDNLVIGADQILVLEDHLFDKPRNAEDAANQLAALSGRRHHLISAVCLAKAGVIVWRAVDSMTLTMRSLSESVIATYLAEAGPSAMESVGAYQLEGRGIRLFETIEGDFFTGLGLPLLPLLAALRNLRAIPS